MPNDASAPRATILVVDDNEANRALARDTLEDEGFRVVLVEDGASAAATFAREQPDCVLLDVRMPGTDGFTVCEQIRALPDGKETPIVFVTALRDVDTFDRALSVGGDDFLTKPIRPSELVVRVEAALKLRKMRVELREHYELLRHQRDDLLRLQLQKERLIAFLVHDLKNPVNAMDLRAQVFLREVGISESGRSCALEIRSRARQLTRMIVNLLDLSKADEGGLLPHRSEVALVALVSEVLSELDTIAQHKNVRLESAVDGSSVRVDVDMVRRMLTNLVENAIRHTPSKSAVRVSAASSSEGIDIRVADAGAGVPNAIRDRIFDPFIRGERASEPSGVRTGQGLGLAFCKVAAQAHDGRIWIEDAAPGAVFCVRLPHVA